ncbi:MAG: hypothetical protein KC776_22730 [Myxococcales bacterium]|nr:hypothetical protein [Myxococcales bacterium]
MRAQTIALCLVISLSGCSEASESKAPECNDAEQLKYQIIAQANDANVVAPCSKNDAGSVLPQFADLCAKYEAAHTACCSKSPKFCN